MATVILGGLFSSSVLNLLILPTLTLRFGRFVQQERALLDHVPSQVGAD
jgi:Cu/Ag efflux pump CusA